MNLVEEKGRVSLRGEGETGKNWGGEVLAKIIQGFFFPLITRVDYISLTIWKKSNIVTKISHWESTAALGAWHMSETGD